jgi:hypothetical protein
VDAEQLKRFLLISGIIYATVLLLLLALLIGAAQAEKYNAIYYKNQLRYIPTMTMERNGVKQEITLPATLEDIKSREKIVLTGSYMTNSQDSLLVKIDGARLQLLVDGQSMLTVGETNTYPDFQKNPSPQMVVLLLPNEDGAKELRLEYTIPEAKDSIFLPNIYLGDNTVLFMHLVTESGIPFAISVLLIFGGFLIIAITFMVMQRVPDAHSLIWIGLSCLLAGIYGFCVNDLSLYLVPAQNLMYIGMMAGLMYFPVPFLHYATLTLNATYTTPLKVLYNVLRGVLIIFVALHLLGILPFSSTHIWMFIIQDISIAAYGFYVFYEFLARANPQARSLVVPCSILILCTLASEINRGLDIIYPGSVLFLAGVLIFMSWTAVLGWSYIRRLLDEAERSAQLELEVTAMNRNLDMQRTLYNNLTQSTEEVRALRHDLRHQLSAIRGYLSDGNVNGALGYVDAISGNIPEIANKLLCDNFAVNAVAVHYLDKAAKNNIQIEMKLVVPKDLGRIPDFDMSIIVGNLLENAIEASLYVPQERRFIRVNSKVVKNRLTLVIDNSFDGTYTEQDGVFYSRKRGGRIKGVGISSVHAVVERYGGSLKYEVANGVFMASLYVKM